MSLFVNSTEWSTVVTISPWDEVTTGEEYLATMLANGYTFTEDLDDPNPRAAVIPTETGYDLILSFPGLVPFAIAPDGDVASILAGPP